jgi:Uma2 family endonuclease
MGTIVTTAQDARFSVEAYLAWIATRPDEERWQLIDGVAMMMTPPTLRHRTIARNLMLELTIQLRQAGAPYSVLHEVGLIVPGVDLFRPEADVAVVDLDVEMDASFAERFYLVAEVLSEGNRDSDIAAKLDRYRLHPSNQYCLILSQTEVRIDLYARAAGWQPIRLSNLADRLDLEALRCACRLSDIYCDTPLARP